MHVEHLIEEKVVKVTNNGMITIPAVFRHKFSINDGDKMLIVEDEGTFRVIPILDDDALLKYKIDGRSIIKQLRIDKIKDINREL